MIKHTPKAHDYLFRQVMVDKRVARDFFETHLPPDLKKIVDLNDLELLPASHVDDLRREAIADLVFKTKIENLDAYLTLMIDHQSKPDPLMAFRIEKYRCNFIAQHVKQHPKTKTIPLVIPMVLYHGPQAWRHSTDVRDLIDAPKHLVNAYGFKPFLLIDLNTIDDDILKQHVWSGVMALALKHIFARDIVPHLKNMATLLQQLDQAGGWSVLENVLTYILDRGQMNKDDFISLIQQELSPELGDKIMTVSEQLIAEGMQKGMQQGIHLAKLDSARKMLTERLDNTLIAKITGLSLDEIRAEAEKLQENPQH